MNEILAISSSLWRWSQDGSPGGGWYFITIDGAAAEAIRAHEAMRRMEFGTGRGFGSVKVEARLGGSSWRTSVFPSKPHGGYLLPVKAAIRKDEDIGEGDLAEVALTLV